MFGDVTDRVLHKLHFDSWTQAWFQKWKETNGPAAVQSKPKLDVNEIFKLLLCKFLQFMVKTTANNTEDVNLSIKAFGKVAMEALWP